MLRPQLEARGIARAGVFGSVGHDVVGASSDVDVIVTPADDWRLDLVDLGGVQTVLEEGFAGMDVDIVVEPIRRPELKAAVERIASMPFERIARCFRDTLSAINLIESWVNEAGGADKAILYDLKAPSGIERQLLVISEAAIRLDRLDPTAAPRLAPGVDWSGI